ncbi:HrpE/YscL family type III secretion apparatus protein [Opitutaceae bacterium EW11]|nr:HrpE/YscL family type III secretion apparatus protein [Opitutaceae bacterium EW11]
MLRLKQSGAEIVADGPILKAADFGAVLEAQEIVARAEAEAAWIREEARKEYERQKELGYREGLEQGKAEMAERVVSTFEQSSRYVSKLEDALIDVVIKSTRRMVGEFESRERVERIVRKALELLRNQNQVRIRVSPAQAEWLQGRVAGLLGAFPRIQFLDVQPDSRLADDGCVLETELGVIDATVETQLRAIEKALVRAIK